MKQKTSIFTNSLLYTMGNLLLKAFSFFLIPLYTAYLSTEEYGVVNLASGFYALAGTLITLSLQYAVVRFYADCKDDRKKVARMYGSVICTIFAIGGTFLVIMILGRGLVTRFFFKGMSFFPVAFLAIVTAAISGIYTVYQEILRGMQEARKSVALSYVYFFLHLGLNILMVVSLKKGATGVLLSGVLTYLIMIAIMFADLLRRGLLTFCIDREIMRELLRYSLPLVPHTIAYNLQTYATRLIINEKLSLAILGVYSLAAQFGAVTDVVLNSVQSAFQPWIYGVLNNKEEGYQKKIGETSYLLMWLYGLMFILIGLFSQEAVLIMASNASYYLAWRFIPAIVFSVSVKAPLYFYTNFLYYDKNKTKYVFLSTIAACVVNILLTYLLTPSLQIYGSIMADVCAMLFRLAIVIYLVKEEAAQFYSFAKLFFLSLLPMVFMAAGLVPAFLWLPDEITLFNIAWKCGAVLAYLLLLVIVKRKSLRPALEAFRNGRKQQR